jgi:hypothetical protein
LLSQPGKDHVLDFVHRRKVHVATFAFDHMVVAVASQHLRHAESAARADDTDYALLRQRHTWPAEMAQMFRTDSNNRVADCTEIIDQGDPVEAEPLADHGGANDPRIVG